VSGREHQTVQTSTSASINALSRGGPPTCAAPFGRRMQPLAAVDSLLRRLCVARGSNHGLSLPVFEGCMRWPANSAASLMTHVSRGRDLIKVKSRCFRGEGEREWEGATIAVRCCRHAAATHHWCCS
jgi:hypothetical protein